MKFKKKVLKNGLRIIMVPMEDNPTVTVLVMVEAGAKYETKEFNGISHFLEHMCFKGTHKRPTALDISRELDSIGAQYNAFTSDEYTGYYAKSAPKHGLKILDVVSDLYLDPMFDEKEIEKEKGVIIEEINMYRDMPHRHVQELYTKLLYGDQPAGWSIAGTKETVQHMTKKDFIEYRLKHYVAEATIVVVSGKFNEERMFQEIQKRFSTIHIGKKDSKQSVIESQKKPEILIEDRSTDQAHLVLGVRGYPIHDKYNTTLKVLTAVLGKGMSSRLFQKLREEMGVGYYIHASYDSQSDHGSLNVSIGVDTKRIEEVVKAVLEEFKRFKNELVPNEELKKAKEYMIGTMFLGLESSDELADFYGHQEIMRRKLRKRKEIAADIQLVTAEDILNVAREIFQNQNLNLAFVGPVKDTYILKKNLIL